MLKEESNYYKHCRVKGVLSRRSKMYCSNSVIFFFQPCVVVCTCNPSIWGGKERTPFCQPLLHSKFQASLGYMRLVSLHFFFFYLNHAYFENKKGLDCFVAFRRILEKHTSVNSGLRSCFGAVNLFLRKGMTVLPKLASNLPSSCFSFECADITFVSPYLNFKYESFCSLIFKL